MTSRFILPFADVGSGIKPSSGAKLFFFETGTSTPKDTFSDSTATTPNDNPVTADDNGVFPDIFIVGTYKVVLKDKNGIQIWETDPVFESTTVDNIGASLGDYTDYVFDTLADAVVNTSLKAGYTVELKERLSGEGGGGTWDVVLTSSVTPNTFNIIQSVNDPSLSFVLRSNSLTDARSFGLRGDDSTDNVTGLTIIDTLGGCRFIAGVYQLHSNMSLTGQYTFNGGVIKPLNSGVTITMARKPDVGQIQCFDITTGGLFKINAIHNFDSVEAIWFGMTPSDTTEVVAKQNMRAIALAVNMAAFGTPGGGAHEPTVWLPIGIFDVDDWEGSGVGANVKSYQTLKGRNDSSYIKVRAGAAAMDVFLVNEIAANSVIFDDFQIDGDYQNQTNEQNGIVFRTPAGPVIYSKVGNGVYIKEMSGRGIIGDGAGISNFDLRPNLVRDCVLGNLYVTAADQLEIRGKYRSSKGVSPSIHITGSNIKSVDLYDVTSEENGGEGLLVSTINTESGSVKVHGGSFSRNGKDGVVFSTTSYQSSVDGAKVERNDGNGVQLFNTINAKVKNCDITANKQRGVLGVNADDCSITGNEFDKNSDTNVNVYDDITLIGSSDNNVQINKHRNSLSTTRYNIAIDDAACVDNLVTNNDMKGSGNTGTITDAGTGTITAPGNRV